MQVIAALAGLCVADHLKDGPKSAATLAREIGESFLPLRSKLYMWPTLVHTWGKRKYLNVRKRPQSRVVACDLSYHQK